MLLVGVAIFIFFARNVMGDMPVWLNFKSAALVLLGTLIAGTLAFPVHTLRGFSSSLINCLKPKPGSVEDLILQIVSLARVQRLADLREMNSKVNGLSNPVLRRGLQLVMDHPDRQRVEFLLEKEIHLYLDQLHAQLNVINRLSRLAPIFGFVGTIIGLINVLNNIGDPTQIGQGMAAALLTTFYGLLFANFLFLPIVGKFSDYSRREALKLNVIYDGVVAICEQRPALEIAHNLKSYAEADFLTPQPTFLRQNPVSLCRNATKQGNPAR
jgi:chemotaxis protein MotA